MNFLKNRFYSFVDDKLQLLSLLGFTLSFVLSLLNYFDENTIEWIMRIGIYGIGIFLVFFFGHKGTWITWCFVAYSLFYFSNFKNVTYFAIICILFSFYPKLKYLMILLYSINVFVISHLHDLDIMKIAFHIGACTFIYFSIQILHQRIKNLTEKPLDLTQDEIIILEYLSRGIQQNDIPEFSAVTVSRKLRQAKIRNGIGKTEQLLKIFNQQKKKWRKTDSLTPQAICETSK